MRRAAALALLLLPAACASRGSDRGGDVPSNPYPDVQTVAVLPVLNQTGRPPAFDPDEFGAILASELIKVRGFRVVRASGQPLPRTAEEAVRLARTLKADAVLVAGITDHDPWDPPRTALSVQFLRTASRALTGPDVDRLVQSGSWRRGPVEMSRDRAGHWIAAFEEVYDAHEQRTRRALARYAETHDPSDTGFPGEREFLAIQARWFQFVSHQAVRRLLEAGGAL